MIIFFQTVSNHRVFVVLGNCATLLAMNVAVQGNKHFLLHVISGLVGIS